MKCDRWGRVAALIKSAQRRSKATSGIQFLVDNINRFAIVLQILIPTYWAIRVKELNGAAVIQQSARELEIEFGCFIVAYLYSTFHRLVLVGRFKLRRLADEEANRPLRLSHAISKFTLSANGREPVPLTTLGEIERCVLEAIKSEVEAHTGDTTGTYLNASLLIEDPDDRGNLKCINRAVTHREFPKTYKKEGMLVWDCMQEGIAKHEPSFRGPGGTLYKSILCLPLMYDKGGVKSVLGVVSIDHADKYEFIGLEEKLKIVLSPYLRLLELALVHRLTRKAPSRKSN